MSCLLVASLGQRQAMTLSSVAFGEAAGEVGNFASSIQQVSNFEDDQLLSLMSKLSQTFKQACLNELLSILSNKPAKKRLDLKT